MNKKVKYRIGLLTAMVCLFAVMSYAANPTGQTGDVAGPGADVVVSPGGDFCAQFPYQGNNFILEVNRDGTGHMLGNWCQDWAPTGQVSVVDDLERDRRTVTFNLAGVKASDYCCDDTCIRGRLIYRLSTDRLRGAIVTWGFPIECDAPCDSWTFRGGQRRGLQDCRSD